MNLVSKYKVQTKFNRTYSYVGTLSFSNILHMKNFELKFMRFIIMFFRLISATLQILTV